MADEDNKDAPADEAQQDQPATEDAVQVLDAELTETGDQASANPQGQVDILLDTPMSIAIEFGRVEMPVRQLLQLGPGAVLRLDKRAGEPVDMYLCGTKFAEGYLVVVGDHLGIRVKEITPTDEN